MSCDFAVWFPHQHLTDEQATQLYTDLCEGIEVGVTAHPAIDALYAELTALHPELDDIPDDRVDDVDYCPWSIAFGRSPGHLIMCCVWSKAEHVAEVIQRLAKKHGLAVYDPQAGRILYPDDPTAPSGERNKPRWKFW